jgi:hypothetical protein
LDVQKLGYGREGWFIKWGQIEGRRCRDRVRGTVGDVAIWLILIRVLILRNVVVRDAHDQTKSGFLCQGAVGNDEVEREQPLEAPFVELRLGVAGTIVLLRD